MSYLVILLSFHLSWASGSSYFSNADLESTLRSGEVDNVMIFTWSPHMPLSIKGLDEAIQFTKSNKIKLIVVLDPNCDFSLAQKVAFKHQWPDTYLKTIQSSKLIERGLRVHYPSYLLIKHGSFSGPTTPGYKSKEELDRMIGMYLK
ncbi:hypothetical protein [Bdellovibrio svalbardensis]|uniref:Thioredoxin domain-containing protein n=1 Tax=Bdellovibrio svalbardensis TaxID=2972972 RepID=A0ABT6DJ41_9BACT|nr:hypothetical protein [Bdellovibrio svalbardensis]MDG0816808.1 hypothetical protein [Bdellovibrio svalbardensis]